MLAIFCFCQNIIGIVSITNQIRFNHIFIIFAIFIKKNQHRDQQTNNILHLNRFLYGSRILQPSKMQTGIRRNTNGKCFISIVYIANVISFYYRFPNYHLVFLNNATSVSFIFLRKLFFLIFSSSYLAYDACRL